ncbi:MAG TPA: sigma-70 family RNA polymerase sigma factor [Gaiellaceae bacterium]|jgi:RNA polymerase sigma-70 factor (ECF subfamily)
MSVVDWGIDAHLHPLPDETTLPDREAEAAAASRREQELVERAKRGDVDAYETLLLEHERFAYRMAYLITRDAGDAEDALQDAFLKAYRALGRFRHGAAFRPWLLKIVTNEARTRSRSRRRHAAIASRAGEREPPAPLEASPESALLSDEMRHRLLAAVDRLPEKLRAVVTCRYLLELSEEETAAMLGIRRGTVKSRLSRALEKLETWLGGTR